MVWTKLHAKIHRTIRSRHLFERNQRLLVAVSGGQDSLCLIKLLLDLQLKWGWELGIAHCDHRWRVDSQANADHVKNLSETWGVSFYLETASKPINSEATAREWRYETLSAIAQAYNYEYIVTGHTASDRAETLLYNLMRGTGADGLQALTWQRPLTENILLVRPLLEITRKQTEQFCQEFQLPIWEDSTNQDLKYARNRIRQELIPYLQANFNPQAELAIAQTAELLQADVEYLERTAQQLKEKAMEWEVGEEFLSPSSPSPFLLRLNRQVLQKAPLALQRRVMRQVLQEILADAPNFEHIEKLTALITAPNRSQTDPFPGGAIAQVQDNWILFRNGERRNN
ncbi:PP-loop [Trichormus variabilis ATCC 29413]|uniref:tRNA(Ile)-lysidine synthase n=2 Tax=Anabaena variabilis TaxID=264691 RepID=Q3MFV1_TRIV2|nr:MULTISPECIES: tRNA lysidine(34) synthetase TilS [Nostocaceae]ABA20135.1 PP-loop [Trichormus variabilis ATCC 29413]MBC1214637.1 tRNA lysidine(34) synthetase TilS [Trichormus variabilis ARAD]MBC1256418.1 tRNA lysidine(34) synthetase TilS [Trichormus variabilis V5]MBC1266745.1 tRNA lysidine(34) synthetase TilS [Trichormus variabilis FSR]MBC1303397.1 tRNA lysidine(34) synthetase TilS [Trichormus variabilis N2B]